MKKAPGWDNLCSENFKYAGHKTLKVITWILNALVSLSHVPAPLKKGLLVPVPKPSKDASIKDNNRGITLVPVLYKILEKLMIKRELKWFEDPCVNHEIQSAGKKGCSCLHSSFIVQETVAYNRNKGNTVYTAFLDTKKAFDTIWIIGLLYKLLKYGINSKMYWILKSAYTDYECTVIIGGETGDWFKPNRGVHQGAPMSMYLYTIYVNELIVLLRNSGHGISIHNEITSSPIHADDLTIMALYKHSLNHLLEVVYKYSVKWRYEYNTDKTIAMLWGQDKNPEMNIQFGNEVIVPINTCKHMGIKLCNNQSELDRSYEERVGSARKVILASRGLGGLQVPAPPKLLSKLYDSIAIPKMLFGLDVTPIKDRHLSKLENANRQNAKMIQGLPNNTKTAAPLATLGWLSIEAKIAIMKVMFCLRTLVLTRENVYRKILISRLQMLFNDDVFENETYIGPIKDMITYATKFNLLHIIKKVMSDDNIRTLDTIKKSVKDSVRYIDTQKWQATCLLYPELSIYCKYIGTIRMHAWWILCQFHPHVYKHVSSVMAVLMGNQPKYFQCFPISRLCKLCQDRITDSASHVLFECNALGHVRQNKLPSLYSHMPSAMKNSIAIMSNDEKTAFILSGLNDSRLINEWAQIMIDVCYYVHHMYGARKVAFDDLI